MDARVLDRLKRAVAAGAAIALALTCGCRLPGTGAQAPTAPVTVKLELPDRRAASESRIVGEADRAGRGRRVQATDFSRIASVRLYTTGVGHNYASGWSSATTVSFATDANGVKTATFVGVPVIEGPRRIFRAQVLDEAGAVKEEVWGVSDVPGPVVAINPYTTPTARVFYELLLTGEARRAEQMNIADVQNLVDTLLNTNRGVSPYVPIDGSKPMIPPSSLKSAPLALAIANELKNAGVPNGPYLVPAASVANGLVPTPVKQGRVTLNVYDSLGEPYTGSASVSLDDPVTDMILTPGPDASGVATPVSVLFDPVPVTAGTPISTWRATVADAALGRRQDATFGLVDGEDKLLMLTLPLTALSEKIAGGTQTSGTYRKFALNRKLTDNRYMVAATDVLFVPDDDASKGVMTLDYADANPRFRNVGANTDEACWGIALDEWGNPLYVDNDGTWNPVWPFNRLALDTTVYRTRLWKEDPLASGVRVPDDGGREVFMDPDRLSAWPKVDVRALAYDEASRTLYMRRADGRITSVSMNQYAIDPATSSTTWSANCGDYYWGAPYYLSATLLHSGNYLFYSRTWWIKDEGDYGAIYRYDLVNKKEEVILGASFLYDRQYMNNTGLTVRAPEHRAQGVGGITLDGAGNLYYANELGSVYRIKNVLAGDALANDWRVNHLAGLSATHGLAYDPSRNFLFLATDASISRVKLQ